MSSDRSCPSGLCAGEAPPLIGSVLTGVGMTLEQAARALEQGEDPPLTPLQRALVERWAEARSMR